MDFLIKIKNDLYKNKICYKQTRGIIYRFKNYKVNNDISAR